MSTAPNTNDPLPAIIDTLVASGIGAFVDWNDPANWNLGAVPDNPFVQVVIPMTPDPSTGLTRTYFITINQGESDAAASLGIVGSDLLLKGALTIAGTATVQARGEIDVSGVLSVGGLHNDGVIQGSGTVSSSGTAINEGRLIGSAMTLSFAGLTNTGTLNGTAGSGLTLDVSGPLGSFTNLSAGTLTGGTYSSTGVLSLNVGGVVTTDSATLILGDIAGTGAASAVIQFLDPASGAYAPLQATLRTIAATGSLALYRQAYTTPLELAVAGQLLLDDGAQFTGPGLTIVGGGIVSGSGTITSPIVNNGTITASSTAALGSTLTIHGNVSGAGILEVGGAYGLSGNAGAAVGPATLEVDGAVAETIQFSYTAGTLQLDEPAAFTGTVASWGGDDEIFLAGLDLSSVTAVSYAGGASDGTLAIQASGTTVNLHFNGNFDASSFVLSAGPQQPSTSLPRLAIRSGAGHKVAALDAVKADAGTGMTPYTFTVTRTGSLSAASTVNFTVIGTGDSPAPPNLFADRYGTVTFAPGASSATATVLVNGASLSNDETFQVVLADPASGSAGAVGTILHNTGAGQPLAATPEPPTAGANPATTPPDPVSSAPEINYDDATNLQKGAALMSAASEGGPGYLQWQFIMTGDDDVALAASAPNVFIHSGGGNDAIAVASGQNVLDGGPGSNFLTGGSGLDTFFTDARAPGAVWNTLRNFHAGDAATLWGFDGAISSYHWESTAMGASGSEGATIRANIVGGNGRTGDGIDASITFAGLSVVQAQGLQIVTGVQAAGSYLFFYNPGV